MDKIQNLLQQVSIIQKKYEDLAEYSGEHYNVFDVLGVTSDELSHSAILTNLLNAKGKHGQKELFLELFLKGVRNKFADSDKKTVLDNFNIKNSFAVKEKYAGRVDYEADQGGRIDIIINDGKNNIIIENKTYAGDQPKQLVRYNEHDKNAPILYLTLDGKEPSPDSKGNLVLNQDFVCISYTDFIKDWLENCIKEMANKPIIRETLNQYIYLIKKITNQTSNNQMSEEIIGIMKNNLSSSFEIVKNIWVLKKKIYDDFIESLKKADTDKFKDCDNDEYYGIDIFEKEKKVSVLFGRKKDKEYALDVSVGFLIGNEVSEIKEEYKNRGFNVTEWWVYKRFPTYGYNNNNWTNNIDFWEDIKNGTGSVFYKDIIEIVKEIIEIEKS